MKEVYLVRHAQAASGPSKMDRDFFLTETGVEQAHVLGRHLQELKLAPDVIYHSKLTRARQTASILTEYISAPKIERLDLIEHGSDAYLLDCSNEEAARRFPNKLQPDGSVRAVSKGDCLSWDFSIGGEDLRSLHRRALGAWENILAAHPGKDGQIVVVSHGSFLSAMLSEIFECSLKGAWAFGFPNAAYMPVQLSRIGGEWVPRMVAHAPYCRSISVNEEAR